MLDEKELVESTLRQREKRNIRDRLAREYLRDHPEVKDDPDNSVIEESSIPEGTSEAAIRSLARHYARQKFARQLVKEHS
jgi:hypothetical protein